MIIYLPLGKYLICLCHRFYNVTFNMKFSLSRYCAFILKAQALFPYYVCVSGRISVTNSKALCCIVYRLHQGYNADPVLTSDEQEFLFSKDGSEEHSGGRCHDTVTLKVNSLI